MRLSRNELWSKSDADDGWKYKVNLGSEKVINSSTNSKQRITTVSVRKEGDVIEKFQTKFLFFVFEVSKLPEKPDI